MHLLIVGKVIVPSMVPVGMLAADLINEQTALPLTIVCAVGGGCWYLSGFLRGLKDGQKATNKRISRIERKMGISEDDDSDDE